MTADIAYLWKKYKYDGDFDARDAIIEFYMPFVRNLAVGAIRKIRAGAVELDDLISDGAIGLMKAAEQFDPERGIKFETYALPVIRGAIYNGIRSMDWIPERTREKTRAFQKAMDNFSVTHGREATESEIAEEMNVDTSEIYNLIADLGCSYLLSLDQPLSSDDEESVVSDFVRDSSGEAQYEEVEFEEQRGILMNAIEELPERDASIIKLYYFSGWSFDKIAVEIGITKQRISQLHSRIIRNLRKRLAELDIACIENGAQDAPPSFDIRI